MKNQLFWKLLATIALGTVALFWAIDWLTKQTERHMSFIAEEHQQQLLSYGREAEHIYYTQGEAALASWIKALKAKEQTWVAVLKTDVQPFADSEILPEYAKNFQLGRGPDWKIHLYFNFNPVIEVPFVDKHTHFLIRLPQRMRPGALFPLADILLQVALPFLLLCIVCYVLYRHVMSPLKKLETTTREFSQGKLKVRVGKSLQHRNDELSRLAQTFDHMADRTSKLIYSQRQLLSDLSHEIRTPLTRIDMAIDMAEQNINPAQALQRLRYESSNMRELVEDVLTIVWLNTEDPKLNNDNFDLVELIQVICDDARFEYPDRNLVVELPTTGTINLSSQQALGQAIENIIRNALRYTPIKGEVRLTLNTLKDGYQLSIIDQGPGVPDASLNDIFKPFFRVETDCQEAGEKSVESNETRGTEKRGGFGLGLALAQRQVKAVGGRIEATNYQSAKASHSGLQITLFLPNRP